MEESEKRRERLRAMRLQAAAEVISSSSSTSSFSQQTLNSAMSPPLANPLLQNVDSNVAATLPPRFDFYTDPVAAYSTDKRRPLTPAPHFSTPYVPTGPRNPGMPLPDTHQFQNTCAPHQGMYQGGAPYHSPSGHAPTSSPMGWNPHPVHQAPHHSPGGREPTSSPMGWDPHSVHQGSPDFRTAAGRGPWVNNIPSPGSGYVGSPNPGYQGSPDFRSPQGRGHWSNNSPSPSLGHGRGPRPSPRRGNYNCGGSGLSPNSGYSGGRGRGRGGGYHDVQARSFYNKSMVEDPWKFLTPTVWKGVKENDASFFTNRRGSSQNITFHKPPTFHKTPSAKKAKISNPFDAANSKQSLAEFLSESFDEAVEDTATV